VAKEVKLALKMTPTKNYLGLANTEKKRFLGLIEDRVDSVIGESLNLKG
jgi:hypothetical protein